jgi:N-carbamoyl-L-amino-acid hydrolase
VVAGLVAAHLVRERGGERPPLAVVSFADEEGGRFGTPTFGSRLAVGALRGADVLDRVDAAGITLREALRGAGVDPDGIGPDPELVDRIAVFVEVHVEQGRRLEDLARPLGVAGSILPHGRWRVDLAGEANHGGTTALAARRDPMPALAEVIRAGRSAAEEERALVTVGKLDVWPNSTNSVAGRVSAWLDVRAGDDAALDRVLERVAAAARAAAAEDRVDVRVAMESRVGAVHFAAPLRERVAGVLEAVGVGAVRMDTGAGHDAAALAAVVPTAMLFVRNPTGVSHSAAESARREDCVQAIAALVAVLDDLGRKR